MFYKESLEFQSWYNIDKKDKICKHIVYYFPIRLVKKVLSEITE